MGALGRRTDLSCLKGLIAKSPFNSILPVNSEESRVNAGGVAEGNLEIREDCSPEDEPSGVLEKYPDGD